MHVTFIVHESTPGHGYVEHKLHLKGHTPPPTGSDPLLGERPTAIIGRRLIALSGRFDDPSITHEVIEEGVS